MLKKVAIISIGICLSFQLISQTNSYGFRAGMNVNTIKTSDLEQNEAYDYNTGFHIGFAFSRNFTDIWGARAEFLYIQKGAKNTFEGSSFLVLKRGERDIAHTGMRKTALTISNSYIDFPLTGFGRITDWLELSAGIVPGILVASTARGDLDFSSDALNSDINMSLNYNYYQNKVGESTQDAETITVKEKATANELTIPSEVGAYYFNDSKNRLYNAFGLDAVAGINIFVNKGLYISARAQYGLLDITNKKGDFSASENNQLRDDKDINLNFQASVGFNF